MAAQQSAASSSGSKSVSYFVEDKAHEDMLGDSLPTGRLRRKGTGSTTQKSIGTSSTRKSTGSPRNSGFYGLPQNTTISPASSGALNFDSFAELLRRAGEEADLEEADLEVVKQCLGLAKEEEDEDGDIVKSITRRSISTSATVATNASLAPLGFDFRRRVFRQIGEHKMFTCIFMFLTIYALFAPDLDKYSGNKTSRELFLILNTFACLMFLFEIIVQACGKSHYLCQAYFWLDTVALISLLPDTWVMQLILTSNEGFVAGRSSRLARIIRVATRSSRVTKMSNLPRLGRIVSLVPRIEKLFGNKVQEKDVQNMLNKKLQRIFRLFDTDMDGFVVKFKVVNFLDSMKADIERSKRLSFGNKSKQVSQASHISNLGEASSDTPTMFGKSKSDGSVASEPNSPGGRRKLRAARINWQDDKSNDDPESAFVQYEEFRLMLLEDRVVGPSLHRAVDAQLRKGTNMKNITSRHSEYVAVRVALGVIMLLALLGVVQPAIPDNTFQMGLEHLATTMRIRYPDAVPGNLVPEIVHQQINMWKWGNVMDMDMGSNSRANGPFKPDDDSERVLWLDIEHLVFCDAFEYGYGNCTRAGKASVYWQGRRPSLAAMSKKLKDADYRASDMKRISVPQIEDQDDLTDEELNERTVATAVIIDRRREEKQALMSILTTLVVIVVILVGVLLLTKDMTGLTGDLLKPLSQLAEEMESLVQLQLAGADDEEKDPAQVKAEKGTDEIRRIRDTFEKMKQAIKSWGKYVPWPVVQMLLRANVEAGLNVDKVDASIYFSDIAGFTTIVESLEPEKSLLLLNRYFNDMTKIIDDHGGVVIEFIGDAILCIYGAPLENPQHPSGAVKAALKMLDQLRKINTWSAKQDIPEVKIRCGVHSGYVLVGNMGFQSRIKYGIVGEDANLPSHLEELNKTYSTTCMISQTTWTRLIPEHFITRPLDHIRLRKGPGEAPENIYQVMARDYGKVTLLQEAAELHAQAMELYRERKFEEAIPIFQDAGEKVKADTGVEKDGPTELLIFRCRSFRKVPPPARWDGVWIEEDERSPIAHL